MKTIKLPINLNDEDKAFINNLRREQSYNNFIKPFIFSHQMTQLKHKNINKHRRLVEHVVLRFKLHMVPNWNRPFWRGHVHKVHVGI